MGNHNNREVFYKGIKFDSVLERNAYRQLEFLKVEFTFHEKTFQLYEGYHTKAWSSRTRKIYKSKVTSRVYTPEFIILDKGREIIIEMKGFRTAAFNLRWDIFRKGLEPNQEAYLIKTVPELTFLIQTLNIKSRIKKPKINL